MVLSLLPIAFAPILGGAAALVVTSVLAMLVDSLFVVLQRYNRPKLVRVMERFDTLKFSIPKKQIGFEERGSSLTGLCHATEVRVARDSDTMVYKRDV